METHTAISTWYRTEPPLRAPPLTRGYALMDRRLSVDTMKAAVCTCMQSELLGSSSRPFLYESMARWNSFMKNSMSPFLAHALT